MRPPYPPRDIVEGEMSQASREGINTDNLIEQHIAEIKLLRMFIEVLLDIRDQGARP